MPRIVLDNLGFGFDAPLFERVSITFDAGFTGLVASNGAGKTTLLRLIAGDLEPTEGRVWRAPGTTLEWCRQESRAALPELRAFALDETSAAVRMRGALGLDSDQLERFERLSSGERKRWQVAQALAREPDVLLLDEPTNHLDGSARELIIRALQHFSGTAILVSHDRALLEALSSRTARIHRGSVVVYPGAYSKAQVEWQAQRRSTENARAVLREAEGRLARRADEQRRNAASAERDRSSSRRMRNAHDHDARSLPAKNKAEAAGRRLARDAAALGARLARVQSELFELHVDKELGGELFADYSAWSKPIVLRVAFDAIQIGARRLLGPSSVDIRRTDKLALIAPNGSGKTSWLGELVRQNPAVVARSVYLPQSLGPDAPAELRARLSALGRGERGRVLGFVAALGSEPDALLRSPAWSPGQARKVALALGLAAHAPALILDEPTNHFDLPSIERLERLLGAFPGCVVLITHDEALAARVATRFFGIEAAELVEQGEPASARPLSRAAKPEPGGAGATLTR